MVVATVRMNEDIFEEIKKSELGRSRCENIFLISSSQVPSFLFSIDGSFTLRSSFLTKSWNVRAYIMSYVVKSIG